jgi:hypothetical protein
MKIRSAVTTYTIPETMFVQFRSGPISRPQSVIIVGANRPAPSRREALLSLGVGKATVGLDEAFLAAAGDGPHIASPSSDLSSQSGWPSQVKLSGMHKRGSPE